MLSQPPCIGSARAPKQSYNSIKPDRRGSCFRTLATPNSCDVTVAIQGAGVAGLAAAAALTKVGVPVLVLERAPALRQEGSALALWNNGWRALDALGVGQQLRQQYLLLDRIQLVSSSNKLLKGFTFEEAGASRSNCEMRGVRRMELLQAMADQLAPNVLQFNSAVNQVSQTSNGRSVLQLADGRTVTCDVLVGADGSSSVVARHLGLPTPKYAGYVAYRGLAHFPDGIEQRLPLNTIRQMYGAGVRAGMYPLTEQGAYWYICFNAAEDAPRPADAAGFAAEALSAVAGWSTSIREAVQHTDPNTISRGSIRDRWTLGSFGKGCVTLVGDAAHPMTPNLGQGGCTALEDSVVLAKKLAPVLAGSSSSSSSSIDRAAIASALREFESERSSRCLPLTVRSYLFGAALQIPYAPVTAVRDLAIQRLNVSHFLDHTLFDCGELPQQKVSVTTTTAI